MADIEEWKSMINSIMEKENIQSIRQFAEKYGLNANYLYQMFNGHVLVSNKTYLKVKGIYEMVVNHGKTLETMVSESRERYGKKLDHAHPDMIKVIVTMTLQGATIKSHNIEVTSLN